MSMRIYHDLHTERLAVDALLNTVSPQRRQQVMRHVRLSDRQSSLAAYLLLYRALREGYGIAEPPIFNFGPSGKPFLKDHPNIHFNLSHTEGIAVCVVADVPVGVDVERIRPIDRQVVDMVMSDDEQAEISLAEDSDTAFYRLWTRKEAYLKLTGEGLRDDMRNVLADTEGCFFQSLPLAEKASCTVVTRE